MTSPCLYPLPRRTRRRWRHAVGCALLAALVTAAQAAGREVPRTIIALYDAAEESRVRLSRIHQYAQMPLEHLGFRLRFHDVNQPLPDIAGDPAVRGVITWFAGDGAHDAAGYLAWTERALAAGKRFAVLGHPGASSTATLPLARVNAFTGVLGVLGTDRFVLASHDADVIASDAQLVGFEHALRKPLPPYPVMRASGEGARSLLRVARDAHPETTSDLVTVGRQGVWAAEGYALFVQPETRQARWVLDPFAFFSLAFGAERWPRPDFTTLSGRRLYFSHIDGDGWRNVTEIEGYEPPGAHSSEVVRRELIEPYADLPVTVAPVVADLSPDWYGSERTLAEARRLFALPQVEAGSHTWTHPFSWRFFRDYDEEKERPFLETYAQRLHDERRGYKAWGASDGIPVADGESLQDAYDVPRAFAREPFSLDLEVRGSRDFLAGLLPPGKRVSVLQWSGDTDPFRLAIAATREIGLRNINGGDTRLDPEYDSLTWVAPVGRPVAEQFQVYAAASNENTYTRLWTDRFFGFRYVIRTIERTGSPRRLKPVNVYYHLYSGQKPASLRAVRDVLEHVRGLQIAPVATSHYAAIADGFWRARVVALGDGRWRIEDRDRLQTLRIDAAAEVDVDLERSVGVIGMRRGPRSLYVALDESHPAPMVALAPRDALRRQPLHLVHGRWHVHDLRRASDGGVTFRAAGFGPGEMLLRSRAGARYAVRVEGGSSETEVVQADAEGRLRLALSAAPGAEVTVSLRPEEQP